MTTLREVKESTVTALRETTDGRMVVQLTAADLRELVRAEMCRALQAAEKPTSRWTDVTHAAKHFGCTSQTIRNWIKLGAPARQIGSTSHPQFRLELLEFEAWVRTYEGKK